MNIHRLYIISSYGFIAVVSRMNYLRKRSDIKRRMPRYNGRNTCNRYFNAKFSGNRGSITWHTLCSRATESFKCNRSYFTSTCFAFLFTFKYLQLPIYTLCTQLASSCMYCIPVNHRLETSQASGKFRSNEKSRKEYVKWILRYSDIIIIIIIK